jgi:nucleoside-diphosphate-sugar epimerase
MNGECVAILITGGSGFIGRALAENMMRDHDVVSISRRDPENGVRWVRGDFGLFEDLRQLDDTSIDAVVHLGAVTGGCSERDAIQVNVEGSRVLMRYAIDRGCRKFVMASSIAAVGMQSVDFRPLQVPITDEHPCLDRDGYGWSKFMMEEVTKYYWRQNADIDVINLRLSSVVSDESPPPLREMSPPRQWGLGSLTIMVRQDAVRAFRMAAESDAMPGVRILNASGPRAWVKDPVADILRNWWGNDVDLSHLDAEIHRYDSVYDVSRIEQELGFVAEKLPGV